MGFAFTALLLGACQEGDRQAPRPDEDRVAARAGGPTDDAYRADVERICGVLSLSGADQRPAGEHLSITAQWLGDNLETEAGRDFMIEFKTTEDPAQTLRDEAKRLGLPGCALADSW